ncbi:pleckstrin homology domain-containing family O member 2 isoform X1 [Poecilia formosa]|uniref:Pleckstrin homology domain containing, family O member 2 n=1 Tax=Poecilia formosa TaxID=48698 RepID=A0A087XEP1_POEFO|nr:PREDICTED: pleckstrin homology domain-containing family O member 2 isoform X1 [Poecilia formosa]
MEDGTKEDTAQQNKPKFLSKAGWVKKAHGRLLTSYKDRYLHVEKTEVVVYENEDLQNCLERLDLENYETCHELKSPFKKKHRLVLIRSPKSGNKIHDVKFQTQTVEEKEAWIKALSDCISRAKNKVFDEVKVDESSNLEHITRTRPQGNRNRRPPTRIHMKEVAEVSSDGLLRLDLNLEDAVIPNGTNTAKTDSTESPETAVAEKQSVLRTDEEKKAIKPPMPPTKEAKSSVVPENEPNKQDEEEKVMKPPMPPSKESKPSVTPGEVILQDENTDDKKSTNPPPTPPNKPSSSGSLSNPVEVLPASPNHHPPTPPSKDKKPSQMVVEPNQQTQDTATEQSEDETAMINDEVDQSEETVQNGEPKMTSNKPKVLPEDLSTVTQPKGSHSTAFDTSARSLKVEEASLQSVPSVVVCTDDPLTETLNLSPLLHHLPGEKKKKAEEKSVDSGQHSDDESESSVSEDTLAASTAALHGSHAGLDVLDGTEGEREISVNLRPSASLQVKPDVTPCRRSEPFQKPLKSSIKARSASIGDLLSDSLGSGQLKTTWKAENEGSISPFQNSITKLETEVALEMKNTSELLSQAQERSYAEVMPEDLLAKALEKLQKADCVLREVKKLKITKKRMSW